MARIGLRKLAHSYVDRPRAPADFAVKELDLAWEDGGAYALLGPSGCGKTTLLNIVSGLIAPSRGDVLFDDLPVTALPTERRNIAQVFQFPVIYDTMTVAENLAFPLKNRGVPPTDIARRVREIAGMLELEDVLARRARGLSADVKQKISLGRGLVRPDVNAILFDEPLTVIDPHLKWVLRSQLKVLHREFDFTMIYVTHDQTEALTFADRVMVMHEGEIVQTGTPQELFDRPVHTFVGYFIGSPGMNVAPCEVAGDRAILRGHEVPLAGTYRRFPSGAAIELGARPEFITLDAPGGTGLPVKVRRIDDVGSHRIARVTLEGIPLNVTMPEDATLPSDDGVIRFDPDRVNIYADGHLVAGEAR